MITRISGSKKHQKQYFGTEKSNESTRAEQKNVAHSRDNIVCVCVCVRVCVLAYSCIVYVCECVCNLKTT